MRSSGRRIGAPSSDYERQAIVEVATVAADPGTWVVPDAGHVSRRRRRPVEPRTTSLTGSTVGSRLGVAPPITVMRFLTPMIPMARNGAATVVSPGSTISASATLSKPMTLTSSGTRDAGPRIP